MRKAVLLMAVAVLVSCGMPAFAGIAAEDANTRLNDIRGKKIKVMNEYDKAVQEVKKAADDKVEGFRKQFHKDRDAVLGEARAKLDELRGSYESEIGPLKAEEKQLVESMGGGAAMNFAKKKI
jgi:hypothetical protein